VVSEWIELVEMLPMWEVWLKSDKIAKRHVKRAEKKHRFIMYLLQKTANQQAGMGLKLTKFHAIVHMATDILHFSMPMCFDMGSNKAGHKPMKKAAKVTQKHKTCHHRFGYPRNLSIDEPQFGYCCRCCW
jgi:hypothetical protein